VRRAIEVLNALERERCIERYAVGGGVAVLFHSEPVLTYDLDVFVLLPSAEGSSLVDLSPLYRRLRQDGHLPEREYVLIEGTPVQFLVAYNALIEEAVRDAVEVPYEQATTRVIRLEHLLAIMAQTNRPKDRERLAVVLSDVEPDQERLRDILTRHGLLERWDALTRSAIP
jgi:hypothetical protein